MLAAMVQVIRVDTTRTLRPATTKEIVKQAFRSKALIRVRLQTSWSEIKVVLHDRWPHAV